MSIENYLSRKDIWHLLRITLGIGIICFMVLGTLFAVVGYTSILCTADIVHIVIGSLMLVTVLAMVLLDCFLVCVDFQLTLTLLKEHQTRLQIHTRTGKLMAPCALTNALSGL